MKPLTVTPRITVFNSDVWQATSTVIIDEEEIWVVDPGFFPREIANIAAYIENLQLNQKRNIMFTHSDFDHIGGYYSFQKYKTWGHPMFGDCVIENMKKLIDYDERFYIERCYETPFIMEELEDGHSWRYFRFFHNQGHTQDGIMLVDTHDKVLVCGDMLSNLEFPFIDYDGRAYEKTLEKVRQLIGAYDINILIPGHGAVAFSQEEILQRLEYDLSYIAGLRTYIRDGIKQGYGRDEMVERMPPMFHRGKLVTGFLLNMHEQNIRRIYDEENY